MLGTSLSIDQVNYDSALQYVADNIGRFGESKIKGQYGIDPQYELPTVANRVAEVIHEETGATHWSRYWDVRGESVRIEFFKAPSYGATVTSDMKIGEEIVLISF